MNLLLAGLFIVLTLPALYERYKDYIDRYVLKCYRNLCLLYVKINEEYVSRVRHWILEKKKLSWAELSFYFFIFFIFILVITFVTFLKYFLQHHWWDCGCRYMVIFFHSKVVSSAFSNFNDGPLFLYIKWWNLLS